MLVDGGDEPGAVAEVVLRGGVVALAGGPADVAQRDRLDARSANSRSAVSTSATRVATPRLCMSLSYANWLKSSQVSKSGRSATVSSSAGAARPIARPLRKIVTGPLSLTTAIVVDGWS